MSFTHTSTTPIWDNLTKKNQITFDLPSNDTLNLHSHLSFESFSGSNPPKTNDIDSNALISVSKHNNIDLAQLLVTQYQMSNLSYDHFINRSALLHELRTYVKKENTDISSAQHRALAMFENYIATYNKRISKPLPLKSEQLPHNFCPFNDRIDVILQYLMQINRINATHFIQTTPAQFDLYFVPPNSNLDLESLYTNEMAYSGPDSRYRNRAGLDDIQSLFCSDKSQRLIRELNTHKTRLVLLIVRGSEYNTNCDELMLFTQEISTDLRSAEYETNESLWNVNSQTLPLPLSGLSNDSLLNVSYHLHSQSVTRLYVYYNGFGERMHKRNIVSKLPFMFAEMNGNHKISHQNLREFMSVRNNNGFNDYIDSDDTFVFGQYLFGLKYQRLRISDVRMRLLNIAKTAIQNVTAQIREFADPNNQLYYYLTWTSKIQVIDGEFSEYTLRDSENIAIFNSELHSLHSNNTLFVVCVANTADERQGKPKWNMHSLLTAYEIYAKYGISYPDLPLGSRRIHNYFQSEMSRNNLDLLPQIVPVRNWNRVKVIVSQKFKGDSKPNFNRLKNVDLNESILESIKRIQSRSSHLSLIPILKIDNYHRLVTCEPLIPVLLNGNGSNVQNIAVSYKISNQKIIVTAIYADPIDVINKSALVDANAVRTYKYLCESEMPPVLRLSKTVSLSSNASVQSHTDQSWIIESLQQQLKDALNREKVVLAMLTKPITAQMNNNNASVPNTQLLNNYSSNSFNGVLNTYNCNFSQINNVPSPMPTPNRINNNILCAPIMRSNPMTFPSLPMSPIPINNTLQSLPLLLLTQNMQPINGTKMC